MHSQIDQLNLGAVAQGNGLQTLVRHLEKQQTLIASIPTIRPLTGRRAARHLAFDYRNSPFTGMRSSPRHRHLAREGTPIYATASGWSLLGVKGLLGRTIIIDHGHGLTTIYGHCSGS